MAVNAEKFSSGLRQRALSYYREMLDRLRGEMHRRTIGKDLRLEGYFKSYLSEVSDYSRVIGREELFKRLKGKGFAFFGDFRTEKEPKQFFLDFIKSQSGQGKTLLLAVDLVLHHRQRHLDRYLASRVSMAELTRHLSWGSDGNDPARDSCTEVLRFAKENRIRVQGIDYPSAGGQDLARRDDLLASAILSSFLSSRFDQVAVLAPDSWLVSAHLPRALRRIWGRRGIAFEHARVFSGSDEIYLKLARKGREARTEAVEIGTDTYGLNLKHPVSRYRAFLNALDFEEEVSLPVKEGFREVLKIINDRLGLGLSVGSLKYNIYSDFEIGFIEKILTHPLFSQEEKERILAYLLKGESYFIPYDQVIYLGNLSRLHASEEAGHYLRYVMAGIEKPALSQDKFYLNAINEALAFLAGKTVVPGREPLKYRELSSKKFDGMDGSEKESYLAHFLGYRVGERLYRMMVRGRLSRKKIRSIFSKRCTKVFTAQRFWHELKMLTKVKE